MKRKESKRMNLTDMMLNKSDTREYYIVYAKELSYNSLYIVFKMVN